MESNTKELMIDLNKRRELCESIYQLIRQDKEIAEELIDEYVYLLDDNRVDELADLCNDELGDYDD
tara:strand:- start:214 stop:411 length:198 start_codon:yes stop_codon:yes gene_type:complete